MDKVIPMGGKSVSAEARREAHLRAFLVFECLPVIVPKAGIAERRKLATDILLMCAGKERRARMTPGLLAELIAVHSSCVHDQEGRCPLLVSTASLCWEINFALGLGNDEDRGFRRCGETCAAKPLGEERFDGNVRRGHRDDDQA